VGGRSQGREEGAWLWEVMARARARARRVKAWCSPSQDTLSARSLKPGRQVHRKLPTVLWQEWWQTRLSCGLRHSFTSVKEPRYLVHAADSFLPSLSPEGCASFPAKFSQGLLHGAGWD
jgi:hypothetical protein